ncbi:MAG: hypothetical protein WAN50_02910 [Minisyncoccia bacterium]
MSKKLQDNIRKLQEELDKKKKELENKPCIHGRKGLGCPDCRNDKLNNSFQEGLKKVNGGNS